ncbi:phosphotransferase [Kineosporia sp. R_H_3]|uniref:phosphotransferase n=1 Tax=Kineosporia sp. R_H_3 TaxID=1961848 RepID=UPI000B4BF698|nr:phosphotransferase [Kineosporia sp. R_H_3]
MTTTAGRVTIELGPSSPRVDAATAQLRHLFPATGVDVHVGYGPPPAGYRVVDAWRVIPSAARPLFLVPVDAGAARRLLTSHNRLRGPKVRAARTAASLAVAGLAAVSGDRTVLRASVPRDVPDDAVDAALVTRHLRRHVPGAVATAVSLRAFHPLAKPTVQVTDGRGRVVAFTKVASDPATGERVEREAVLLRDLGAGLPGPAVRLPRVLDHGTVGPFTVSVVEPLPQSTRGARRDDEDRVLDRLATFAAAFDDAGPATAPLRTTALWTELTARVRAVTGPDCTRPDLADALRALTESVERADGDRPVAVGAFHGDWVPWNMGWAGDTLWVWDLEYGSRQGPVGLDALRWVYQCTHVLDGATFTEAVAAMAAAGPRVLPRLGVPAADVPDLVRTLVRVHLVAVLSTALAALAAGRGLPPGLDPDAAAVLRTWTAP